jgi:tetratricopeptide (TPR) repeat protein
MQAPAWMKHVDALKQALAARDRAASNAAVAALLDVRAPLGEQWRKLAELMQVSGELTLAHRAIDAFVAGAGGVPQARYAKVVLLTQSGRLAEAHDLLASLPADVPDAAGHAYVLGNTAMTLGRVEEARELLERAVKLRPGWGPAWLTLASASDFATGDLGERLLADGAAAERHHPAEFARYCYALGKLHVDRGDHAAAFAAFDRGARLLRKVTPYSRAGNAANAQGAMTGFDNALFAPRDKRAGRVDTRPIFVTGLPRSGTTLVEHILNSHSTVDGGGELNITQHVAVAAGGSSGGAIATYLAKGGTLDDLADLYLHLLAERFPGNGRIVDKTIDVSRYLGLIAAALPDAPLIWMRRDPLDNAWSAFRTFFIHGVAWSYSLTDIAHHFLLEDALCTYWQERLGERLLVVPYGALIDDPEAWTRRLLAHCGLSEEPAVFKPHESKRAVATASTLQVRRPINRDGMGVAEPYRQWLQPFADAYGAPPSQSS